MIDQIYFWLDNWNQLLRPLVVGSLVAIVCSVVGCFIVLRRMAFLADAIAHSMLAGVIAGYLLLKVVFGEEAHLGAMLLGAIIAGMITVGLVSAVAHITRLKEDTVIGIMYTGIFALGAFVISLPGVARWIQIDIYHYLVGSVLAVSNTEVWLLVIVASVVLSFVILFFRNLQLLAFDPVMAASIGIPIGLLEYALTASTSLVVVSGVQVVGVILVVALLITPAATAYLLVKRLDQMIYLAIGIGLVGFWLGFAVAVITGAAPGPSVVVTMTLIFAATAMLSPPVGSIPLLSARDKATKELKEDLLAAILRLSPQPASQEQIAHLVQRQAKAIQQGLNALENQNLISVDAEQSVALTPAGQQSANRLLRAHRLWETYLQRTGTPGEELHPQAHILEHITDEGTMDYLDDQLGHPLLDPHGKQIPEIDFTQGKTVSLSRLRPGTVAEVVAVGESAQDLGLATGTHIIVGARNQQELVWQIQTVGGVKMQLNHQQADQIWVRLPGITKASVR